MEQTVEEISAIEIANKYRPFDNEKSVENKLKWLAGEVLELTMAIAKQDRANIDEEIGDVLYLTIHLASHFNPKKSIIDYITDAKEKMIYVSINGKK